MRRVSLSNPFDNAPVYFLEETDSTMDDAEELIRRGCPSGTVVRAAYQRQGRGRIPERRWISEPGANLLFTLILKLSELPLGLTALPLRCGLGLAYCLEEAFQLQVAIKWPNDCLIEGRKLAGILCRGGGGYGLIGMGINLFSPGAQDLRRPAAGIAEFADLPVKPGPLLELLLPRLKRALESPHWREEVESRLYARGRTVRVFPGGAVALHGEESYLGRIAGLDTEGGVVIVAESGRRHRLVSGELEILD